MTDEKEIQGLGEAYAVNLKRMIERGQALDEERQGQQNRMVEEYLNFNKQVNQIAITSMQAFVNSMNQQQKDVDVARVRKEQKIEERMEELEETMTRQVATINESIAGVIAELVAAGILKVNVTAENLEETKP